ncbi:hypothetical protein K438DRAFT_1774764 [Mycena galopus ATCC 62051]|nr:hypothetical protein K438DRAFT_1774764 [Mycena galopus ATCC 62051]
MYEKEGGIGINNDGGVPHQFPRTKHIRACASSWSRMTPRKPTQVYASRQAPVGCSDHFKIILGTCMLGGIIKSFLPPPRRALPQTRTQANSHGEGPTGRAKGTGPARDNVIRPPLNIPAQPSSSVVAPATSALVNALFLPPHASKFAHRRTRKRTQRKTETSVSATRRPRHNGCGRTPATQHPRHDARDTTPAAGRLRHDLQQDVRGTTPAAGRPRHEACSSTPATCSSAPVAGHLWEDARDMTPVARYSIIHQKETRGLYHLASPQLALDHELAPQHSSPRPPPHAAPHATPPRDTCCKMPAARRLRQDTRTKTPTARHLRWDACSKTPTARPLQSLTSRNTPAARRLQKHACSKTPAGRRLPQDTYCKIPAAGRLGRDTRRKTPAARCVQQDLRDQTSAARHLELDASLKTCGGICPWLEVCGQVTYGQALDSRGWTPTSIRWHCTGRTLAAGYTALITEITECINEIDQAATGVWL